MKYYYLYGRIYRRGVEDWAEVHTRLSCMPWMPCAVCGDTPGDQPDWISHEISEEEAFAILL